MRNDGDTTLRSPGGGPTGHAHTMHAGVGTLDGHGGLAAALLGRAFVHPAVDFLLIGGALSLLLAPWLALLPDVAMPVDTRLMAWVLLLANSAHFAASSARLYARRGVSRSMPFLAIGLPFAAAFLFAAGLVWPRWLAPALETLYLTWSPYHYAAQAYGISLFYAHRAGRRLEAFDRRALWLVAIVPFVYMLARAVPSLVPAAAAVLPSAGAPFSGIGSMMMVLGLGAPVALWLALWARDGQPLPVLSLLPILSNGIWFFVFDPLDAFLWATIFHGVQYMTLVLAFRAAETGAEARRTGVEATAGRRLGAVAGFYVLSVGLGYALFVLLPAAGAAAGGAYGDSRLLAVALVNIHHFIVDARIWRLRGDDQVRRSVEGAP
jgi:hypothetical protein